MRLKSLRKERPTFEIEGAVINGNRMGLSKGDLKPTKHRSNTSFALPASLNINTYLPVVLASDRTNEMSMRSRQQTTTPTIVPPSNLPAYQNLEAAYLEHGIRIRFSPTRTSQQSERQSVPSLQRHTAFVSRNPSRTSSVLHYTTNNLDQHHHFRPFSALQQISSNDFEQTNAHNVSYAQSLQTNEETHYHDDCLSPSIIVSEHSNPRTPPGKVHSTNTSTLFDNNPDLVYMSTLLKQQSGDVFRDTIRRRAGLRGTFSIHRNPLTTSSVQPQLREISPRMNRSASTRPATIAVPPPAHTIDKDIIKHASRIRKMSSEKDFLSKSFIATSPLKITSNDEQNQNYVNKSLKSMSLEPLEYLLSPARRPSTLSAHDPRSMTNIFSVGKPKTSTKRTKSAKISPIEGQKTDDLLSKENVTSSSTLRDGSLTLMHTSPLDITRQTSSFDSGYYEHSGSSGDVQSLTSSTIMQAPSSIPSARLMSSAARRSNSNKRVSFYEEPTTVVLSTATYV